MNEPQFIKCHVYAMDGIIKDYNIEKTKLAFDYKKYLHNGELYFQEKINDGQLKNIAIFKNKFDSLVNPPKKISFAEWRNENKRQYAECVRKSKMTKCKVCNGDIAKSAKTCPHCGLQE